RRQSETMRLFPHNHIFLLLPEQDTELHRKRSLLYTLSQAAGLLPPAFRHRRTASAHDSAAIFPLPNIPPLPHCPPESQSGRRCSAPSIQTVRLQISALVSNKHPFSYFTPPHDCSLLPPPGLVRQSDMLRQTTIST